MAYHRRPQTTNERRACEEARAQGVKVRAARNERNLPNSYDDLGRHPYTHRSWKKYRGRQWKGRKPF